MDDAEKYRFKLRPDMPPGFIKNEMVPELPVMTEFLKQFNGQAYSRVEEFSKVLKEFPDYLEKSQIPNGIDKVVREGLYIRWREGIGYVILCYASGMPGACEFGMLERIVEQ